MIKVVATDGLHKAAQEKAAQDPKINLEVYKGLAPDELVAKVKDADVLLVRSATKVTSDLMNDLPNLKAVIRAGVGVDNIDRDHAAELGIHVWNAPLGNFQSTAELAIGMIFSVARNIPQATIAGKAGTWAKSELSAKGRQVSGATLGIYGAGNIGMRAAKAAAALGMTVQICDPIYEKGEYEKVDFDQLLATSDFITIHAPILPSTKHAFNKVTFAKMKSTAFIINCARGGIICDEDLLSALEAGEIAGAGLDVYEVEPFEGELYAKLLAHPNVVATPHMGAATQEAQSAVGIECIEKVQMIVAHQESGAELLPALNKPENSRL